jgi:1-deoxy-D-xylulose-5-phosphate reductoisomerase
MKLDFMAPDRQKYPSLDIAFAALAASGTMPAVMNAANEEAVKAFGSGIIRLPQIWDCVQSVMQQHNAKQLDSLDTAIAADAEARRYANEFINKHKI